MSDPGPNGGHAHKGKAKREIIVDDTFESFQCVLLDANGQQMGVWVDAEETLKLRFMLFSSHAEPHIDIRFTIKWKEGKIPYGPVNPRWRVFGNQIKSIETLAVIPHAVSLLLFLCFLSLYLWALLMSSRAAQYR